MASEYPFQKIVGVELLAELHRVAEENIAAYQAQKDKSNAQSPASHHPASIESLRMDARNFVFPEIPLVLYLFNPLTEPGLRSVLRNLEQSWLKVPRPIWLLYHNPVMENVLAESRFLKKEDGKPQYSLFAFSR
jgi:hypothetical protein